MFRVNLVSVARVDRQEKEALKVEWDCRGRKETKDWTDNLCVCITHSAYFIRINHGTCLGVSSFWFVTCFFCLGWHRGTRISRNSGKFRAKGASSINITSSTLSLMFGSWQLDAEMPAVCAHAVWNNERWSKSEKVSTRRHKHIPPAVFLQLNKTKTSPSFSTRNADVTTHGLCHKHGNYCGMSEMAKGNFKFHCHQDVNVYDFLWQGPPGDFGPKGVRGPKGPQGTMVNWNGDQ